MRLTPLRLHQLHRMLSQQIGLLLLLPKQVVIFIPSVYFQLLL